MKLVEMIVGILSVVGLLWLAMHLGGKEGAAMAECVIANEREMGEYMTDREAVHRLAVGACSKYNSDGVVKIPLGK